MKSLVLATFVALAIGKSANKSLLPLSIPPSELWYEELPPNSRVHVLTQSSREGADGQWSTFVVEVGTPPQAVRLLPGTSANAGTTTWVVREQGCTLQNPQLSSTACASSRGGLFKSNDSTSWSTQSLSNSGVFELTTEYAESYLGLDGVGAYGFDTLSLGLNTGLPTLSRALIGGLSTNNYWIGSLGLSRWPFNFSNFDDPQPSLLTTLFNHSQIPSLSWAYTAGAAYRNSYGSLTLGGYDTTRHGLNTSSFPFGPDQAKDLLVTLSSITYDTFGSIPLLTQDIDILVDSMVTHLWLPTTVCHAFEQAFNLTWNETLELYVLDDSTHEQLLAQKPTFKFTITDGNDSGNAVDISLPYAAFDLSITQPYVEMEQRYFPLKRAHNDSQFTLGRVFLQEAYIIADYGRRNFSIAQALFPGRGVSQQLVSVYPPGFDLEAPRRKPSAGIIAGIVVGGVTLLAIVCGLGSWLYIRKRRQRGRKRTAVSGPFTIPSFTSNEKTSSPGQGAPLWDNGSKAMRELQSFANHAPQAGNNTYRMSELEAPVRVHEIDGRSHPVVELEAPLR
ncbi:acid protease [Aureobasidium pullulans]|uniref:Acid protease n=1 Tax=Aureobasidium pullulans TaxID=5580 RepID=A0A4S9V9D1_AURPU|nr:acid protease [Aureobasidium pullulans]